MSENFPEGTSQSDPSAVPRQDEAESREQAPGAPLGDDQDPGPTQDAARPEAASVDEEPENQQTG